MAKNDAGYRKVSSGRSSYSSGGRGMSEKTFLKQTTKDEFTDMYIRTRVSGILDPLRQHDNEDLRMQIVKLAEDELNGMTKAEIDQLWESAKIPNRVMMLFGTQLNYSQRQYYWMPCTQQPRPRKGLT